MNETVKNLISRRSIKCYNKKSVPKELLDKILEAGTYAPTGKNMQSPIIIAITDPQIRDKVSRMNAAVLGTGSDPFYGAPIVLVVLADRRIGTYIYDGSLVMGNLMNAAHSLGVSSCWIHRAREVFDSDEGKDILRSVGLSDEEVENYEGIGNCVLGYTDAPFPTTRPRKDKYIYYIE